jgi:hypothetical protein
VPDQVLSRTSHLNCLSYTFANLQVLLPAMRKIILALLFTSLVATSHAGEFMFFTKKVTAYPFSGFEGQLLYHGEPAANAIVKRTYDWDGTLHEETIQADAEGRFHFNSVSVQYRESLSQFSSSQRVFVNYAGEEYLIWACGKIEEAEFGEFGGEPKNLTCEITAEMEAKRLPNGPVGTNCTWTID